MRAFTRRDLLRALPATAVVAGLAGQALARAREWVVLGERVVDDRVDHDAISVTAARGDYEAVQVRVLGHAVRFRDMKIHYADGRTQDVELRGVIGAGQESRVIDLAGNERVIRTIELWYDAQTARRGRKARVRVLGRL